MGCRVITVGIMKDHGLEGRSSIPGKGKTFSLLHSVQSGSGTHSASYPVGTGDKEGRAVKPTTYLHLVMSIMAELYLHSPTCLHGIVLK
jgi:hypothetical protein